MTIKLHAKHVAYYALGLVATKLISLITLPIMTHLLNPSQFGNLEILLALINLVSIVLSLGLSESIFRFGGMAKTSELMHDICSNAVTLSLLVGLLLCSPLIIFASQVARLLPGDISNLQVIFVGLALIPGNVLVVQLDWLRLKEDVTRFVLVNFLWALLQAILVILSLYAGYGVTGIMFINAITTITMVLYFLIFQFDAPLRFNAALQKKLFLYGVPLSFSGLAEFMHLSLSSWWIAHDVGPAEMAPFALAMKFSLITTLLIQPFYMWWDPNRYKHLNTKTSRLYSAFLSEIGVTLTFLGAYVVIISGSIIIFWFIPSSYHQAIFYLPVSCFILAIKCAANMMNTGLFIEKPQSMMYVNSVMAIFTLIGFYFFIPLWHVWGALLVLYLLFSLRWAAYVYLSQKKLYLPYRYLKLMSFVFICELCGFSAHWMKNSFDYIVFGGGLLILQLVLAYQFQLLPPYKKIMKSL